MKQVLLIIDVQEVFFNHPEYNLFNDKPLVSNINELIKQAREKSIPVIFIQHTDQDEQDLLFEGKDDWQLHKGLDRLSSDKVIQKTKWDGFYQTELLDYLKQNEIEKIIFAGAQTEFCLDTTIRAAYSLGFQKNLLVKDTHSTLDSNVMTANDIITHHENVWNNRFVTIIDRDTKI